MLLIYNFFIALYSAGVRIAALAGKRKAKLWIEGRKGWRERLKSGLTPGEQRVWFHCSSLGEFEQGRPVMEAWRKKFPSQKIVLTFFSPSGYEVRKNYDGADHVFYLPIDSRPNAHDFLELVRPSKAFFVKYEYWHHYFHELNRRRIPLYMVSAVFRNDQPFFKWYGSFFRKILRCVSFFFVQNNESAKLLESAGVKKFMVTGDTRFDRVVGLANERRSIPAAEGFCNGRPVLVAGSTWPEDERKIAAAIRKFPDVKIMLAPHEISKERLSEVSEFFAGRKIIRFSEASGADTGNSDVLLIDNFGLLSSLYRYGDFAYVGGGFGSGIHNVPEAAVYGLPVFFGPNYRKFNEARELIEAGGAVSVNGEEELSAAIRKLLADRAVLEEKGKISRNYILDRAGATEKIMHYLN